MSDGATTNDSARTDGETDDIATLIARAGRRRPVPPERMARARSAVEAHWQQVVRAQARRRRRGQVWLAAAASVVLALGGLLLWRLAPDGTAPGAPAMVERVQGEVVLDGRPLAAGTVVTPGALLETAPGGRVAVRLAGGQSMRLDRATRLTVAGPRQVTLAAGAVYFDVPPDDGSAPVTVQTPLGVARDLGTQFQVRLRDGAVIVGVREGLVEIERPGTAVVAVPAGEFVELSQTEPPQRRSADGDDARWRWAESIAPDFELEGATLASFLEWYARERGLELRFADPQTRQRARRVVLSGSIAGLDLDAALAAVSRTSPFSHRVEDGVLSVSLP